MLFFIAGVLFGAIGMWRWKKTEEEGEDPKQIVKEWSLFAWNVLIYALAVPLAWFGILKLPPKLTPPTRNPGCNAGLNSN